VPATFTPHHRGGSGEPLVLLHGFTDTWRTWELVLEPLERRHDVLALTLPGHAGGPPMDGEATGPEMADQVEAMLDAAGIGTAHLAGNSLGGYLALVLAARGRARSVVALAPAGGWADGDTSYLEVLDFFETMQAAVRLTAPHAERLMATPEGRRRATAHIVEHPEHLTAELLAHQIAGAASCRAAAPLIAHARTHGWPLDPEAITCPVRFVWGTRDQLLPWPRTAARYRAALPQADWVELDGVGHCPQLDCPLETAQLILGHTAP